MKKIILVLCVVAALIFIYNINCTHDVYEIEFTETMISNNSVGNSWEKTYVCDGKKLVNKERFIVPVGTEKTINIKATIVEHDKWDDVGNGFLRVVLKGGNVTSSVITVRENRGRYRGNTAQWKINCKVKHLKRIIKKEM